MPAYVDTSALVKRYVAEVSSAWLRRLLAAPGQQVIYTCTLVQAEVISALQRRMREGRLEAPHAQRLSQRVADPQGLALAVPYPTLSDGM